MSFRGVFIAVFLGTSIVVGAFLLNSQRPGIELDQPTADLVRASGRCAQCHREETPAIVHQFEGSRHARIGLNCLQCHQAMPGQDSLSHRGFTIAAEMTAMNCAACHAGVYDQYLRSRHAAPAWAAVTGPNDFTEEQVAFAETYHPGAVDRAPNALAQLEPEGAIRVGCQGCHDVGKPNADGSIGTCTDCHSRHMASVALAREPQTCGQCHMGPDHSQLEIYTESKHGVLYQAQRETMNLSAPARELTTADMPVPTCATCHMSGLEGIGVTHDVTERLSWWLFAPISDRRPNYQLGQAAMKDACTKCHVRRAIDRFYDDAEVVVASTNEVVRESDALMAGLRAEGLLTPEPFDEPIEFLHFDLWHYYGRTAKHGAFMGGPDFVQWHGNYQLLLKSVEMAHMADALRSGG